MEKPRRGASGPTRTLRRLGWLGAGLFTAAADIHAVGSSYFAFVGPSYPFVIASMVIATAFQGLGRATVPLTVMAIRVVLVLVTALALGSTADTIFAIIAAGNVCGCLALAWLFRATLR